MDATTEKINSTIKVLLRMLNQQLAIEKPKLEKAELEYKETFEWQFLMKEEEKRVRRKKCLEEVNKHSDVVGVLEDDIKMLEKLLEKK